MTSPAYETEDSLLEDLERFVQNYLTAQQAQVLQLQLVADSIFALIERLRAHACSLSDLRPLDISQLRRHLSCWTLQ